MTISNPCILSPIENEPLFSIGKLYRIRSSTGGYGWLNYANGEEILIPNDSIVMCLRLQMGLTNWMITGLYMDRIVGIPKFLLESV